MSTNIKNGAVRPTGAARRAGLAKVPISPVIVPSGATAQSKSAAVTVPSPGEASSPDLHPAGGVGVKTGKQHAERQELAKVPRRSHDGDGLGEEDEGEVDPVDGDVFAADSAPKLPPLQGATVALHLADPAAATTVARNVLSAPANHKLVSDVAASHLYASDATRTAIIKGIQGSTTPKVTDAQARDALAQLLRNYVTSGGRTWWKHSGEGLYKDAPRLVKAVADKDKALVDAVTSIIVSCHGLEHLQVKHIQELAGVQSGLAVLAMLHQATFGNGTRVLSARLKPGEKVVRTDMPKSATEALRPQLLTHIRSVFEDFAGTTAAQAMDLFRQALPPLDLPAPAAAAPVTHNTTIVVKHQAAPGGVGGGVGVAAPPTIAPEDKLQRDISWVEARMQTAKADGDEERVSRYKKLLAQYEDELFALRHVAPGVRDGDKSP